MNNKQFIQSHRKHVCLISNHGYAGVKLPISEAPDTGGQNIFVHYLAHHLARLNYKITIFTRGGFPFYQSKKIRRGIEFLAPFIRYVYVPAGPSHFIYKEDLSPILDEEVEWIYYFIQKEAQIKHMKPYHYFQWINSHYWDGGIITNKLIKMEQTDFYLEQLKSFLLIPLSYIKDRHKLNLSHNVNYYTGEIILTYLKSKFKWELNEIKKRKSIILKELKKIIRGSIKNKSTFFQKLLHTSINNPIEQIKAMELLGEYINKKKLPKLYSQMNQLNRHIWLPHTLGALKEKNYWDKETRIKQKLKFLERNHYEKLLVRETPIIISTSQEIIQILKSYYNVDLNRIIYFPPCNDDTLFKPRPRERCQHGIRYLQKITKIHDIIHKQILLESSRMDYSKRKDILIRALNIIKDKYKNLILLLGGGPQNEVYAHLKKLVHRFKLQKRVFFIGYLNDTIIGEIFSLANVYISPSEMEGFGISLLNAAASKVPIISSPTIPITKQYFKNHVITVSMNQPREFSKAIETYLLHPDLRRINAHQSYHIAQKFKWNKFIKNFIHELKRRNFV